MPPKKRTPQPIDRPLSRAYLRGFTSWSTAYPPGASDPASVRVMDNVWIDRNGSIAVRPGLRCLSYLIAPDSPEIPDFPGMALLGFEVVGSMELFYTADGSRAMLFAVRFEDGTVGFKALLLSAAEKSVYDLDSDEIGFRIPDGEEALRFSSDTRYVKYLQINNKILALSDAAEPARYFDVGERKVAKVLSTISVPDWVSSHKLSVIHPDADWINDHNGYYETFNGILNPTFEGGYYGWTISDNGQMTVVDGELKIESKPSRINCVPNPLRDVDESIGAWSSSSEYPANLSATVSHLKIEATGPGRYVGQSNKFSYGVKPLQRYVVAFTPDTNGTTDPELLVDFYTIDGAKIESTLRIPIPGGLTTRYVSDSILVPDGTVSMRIGFGGTALEAGDAIWIRDVIVCQEDESTTGFDGESGTNYHWLGTEYATPSVYHQAANVTLTSNRTPTTIGVYLYASIDVRSASADTHSVRLRSRTYSPAGAVDTAIDITSFTPGLDQRVDVTKTGVPYPSGELSLEIQTLGRGEVFYVDNALLCSTNLADPGYFDGGMADTSTLLFQWEDELRPHASRSRRAYLWSATPTLVAETPAADTLIKAGGSSQNPYKMAFFYTFENETGESTPSQITEVRMQRPWSNWYWEEPDGAGEPSGTPTTDPFLACDQLVASIPEAVYDQAVAEGALKWNLYAMSWSDQAPVPVEADLVGTGLIRSSPDADPAPAETGRRLVVTPRKLVTSYALNLPTKDNRTNYSQAPRHRNGIVAGERMILVGDPTNPASIQWTSNSPADSMNFTPTKGGGTKTLTTGNLNIPVDVQLWQNPQSVDTITILCNGDDGESIAYYMSPASVNQNSAGTVVIMGFEQVTDTPGTEAVYGSEVMNNALFRPVDHGLVKSTANNYSLKHKAVTDDIANGWHDLRNKQQIVTAQIENRLYMLVNNALGELLEPGCRGNEIWVYDIASEAGSWSRFTIQAHTLKVFTVGNRARLGVIKPEGIFYLDPYYRKDDWVDPDEGYVVQQRPIEWYFETNTQGANRAHDAWCHLQQVVPTFGNLTGAVRYGIKALSVDGKRVDREKVFTDYRPFDHEKARWDVDDALLVRRDMKEWSFFAGNVPGEYSHGQVHAVQYRYAPVSVNVGYEFGSLETFEYGRNVTDGGDVYSDNGIPTPYMDYSRP